MKACRGDLVRAVEHMLGTLHDSTEMKGDFAPLPPEQFDSLHFSLDRGRVLKGYPFLSGLPTIASCVRCGDSGLAHFKASYLMEEIASIAEVTGLAEPEIVTYQLVRV